MTTETMTDAPLSAEAAARHARSVFASGDFEQAERLLEEGLRRFPKHPDLLHLKAESLIGGDRLDEASLLLHRLAAIRPAGSSTDHVFLGIALDFQLPIDTRFWWNRVRAASCLAPSSLGPALLLCEFREILRNRNRSPAHSAALSKAVKRLFVIWSARHGTVFSNGAFQAVVDLKQFIPSVSVDRVEVNTALLLADTLGQTLAREWFSGRAERTFSRDRVTIELGGVVVKFGLPNLEVRSHFRSFFMMEPGLLRHLASLAPGETFLDIGANIGKYTILAAGLGLTVDAIEPFARNIDELGKNVALNAHQELVRIHHIALSDHDGEGWVAYDGEKASDTGQSISDDLGTDPRPGARHKDRIPVHRVDRMVEDGRIAFPNHVKIDVDGVEHKVLAGMSGILRDPRLKSIRLEIRLEDPRNARALKAVLDTGFVARVSDDRKNLMLTRS